MTIPYQARVHAWILACFGAAIGADRVERNHRFLEEALELVQAAGCTAHEAHALVDYVYGRPVGALGQEVGGVMTTLAALCTAHGIDLEAEAERELARVWTKIAAIRAKQQAKPLHSPLPGPAPRFAAWRESRGDCPRCNGVGLIAAPDGGDRGCTLCGGTGERGEEDFTA